MLPLLTTPYCPLAHVTTPYHSLPARTTPSPGESSSPDRHASEARSWRRQFAGALVCAVPIFAISMLLPFTRAKHLLHAQVGCNVRNVCAGCNACNVCVTPSTSCTLRSAVTYEAYVAYVASVTPVTPVTPLTYGSGRPRARPSHPAPLDPRHTGPGEPQL
jgi:hypothetical protein